MTATRGAPIELSPPALGVLLGRGGAGEVWSARLDGVDVAVKLARDPALLGPLLREGERLVLARAAALPRLLGAARVAPPDGGTYPALVLERVPGAPPDAAALRPEERARWALIAARDVGRCLAELHGAGVAHGDVKPANLLLDAAAGRVRVVDLGLVHEADAATPRGGTPRYLAPETGSGGDGRRRDLWALGLTLAELGWPALASTPPEQVATAVAALIAGPGPAPDASPGAAPGASPGAALGRLVSALLQPAPGARPEAAWVERAARAALGEPEAADEGAARRHAALERAWLRAHGPGLERARRSARVTVPAGGRAGALLGEAVARLRALDALRPEPGPRGAPLTLGPLDAAGRALFLGLLAGPAAARWAAFPADDAALFDALHALVEQREPEALRAGDLGGAPAARAAGPAATLLALGAGTLEEPALGALERALLEAPGRLPERLTLARLLRLRGHTGRALALLDGAEGAGGRALDGGASPGAEASLDAEARVEAAECWRRAGDGARARAAAEPLAARADELGLRARAVLGRLALDAGDAERALALIGERPALTPALEVVALARLARGEAAAARQAAELGATLARSDEERARAAGVLGAVHHAAGETERALAAFEAAAAHAERAGAALEEATWLTGVAAAATQHGALERAVQAARRATLLFQLLGRPADAARAELSQAAVHASLGLGEATREAAERVLAATRASGDRRCAGFAHLCLADALGPAHPEAAAHAERAAHLLAGGAPDDALRAAARVLGTRPGALDAAARAAHDAAAIDPAADPEARLDWWHARLADADDADPSAALAALAALLTGAAPPLVRGRAFALGARRAAEQGDAALARRLRDAAGAAAQALLERAGSSFAVPVAGLAWLAELSRAEGFSPEQLGAVQALVRSLGQRDALKPLLAQVLDALILWTGAERGALLLPAPAGPAGGGEGGSGTAAGGGVGGPGSGGVGGPGTAAPRALPRLVVRAARNLARADLTGDQLVVSRTLAERALASRAPVVAVDAQGELSSLHHSVHALRLRSVLAVPLLARDQVIGVVYLDDRSRRGAFGERELAWVRLVSTLASLAIADARDQLLLRRALRRAARAEERLRSELALQTTRREVAERALSAHAPALERPLIGESPPLLALLALVRRVAAADVPALVVGESGSGKELVARALHELSPRSRGPFVSENCGAVPEGLLEATLFGHVKGAFTGAARARAGLFEAADGGTLFLDEIGEMPLAMQTRLLRVIEQGEVVALGSERPRAIDVRVVAATHRNLGAMVAEGRFREDLLYRLDVITLTVPPLRDRPGDIPLLVKHFLARHAPGRRVTVSRGALTRLTSHPWPGNVRQLENELRRALVLADDTIELHHLSPALQGVAAPSEPQGLDLRQHTDALERRLVKEALGRTAGNQTRAAELLGLSRFGLHKMLRRLELVPDPDRAP